MRQGLQSLGLSAPLVGAVTALGYEEPTPIQREAIPVLLAGQRHARPGRHRHRQDRGVRVAAARRLSRDAKDARGKVRALVLVPTRELAMQVAEALHKYAKGSNLNVVPVYGGAPMDHQIRALRRGTEVVVGTPGPRARSPAPPDARPQSRRRCSSSTKPTRCSTWASPRTSMRSSRKRPTTRQTALFAATFAPRIMSIAGRHLKNPKKVQIAQEKRAPGKLPQVRQVAFIVGKGQKIAALSRILDFESPKSAIVFCRTRLEVDELTDTLNAHGYGAQALHGGMVQKQRDRVMQLFRTEKADILVATDVAARGLDIEHVSHVDQLRSADGARSLRASHRPHRPHRPRGRGDHAAGAARAAVPAIRRAADQAEDRNRQAADRGRPAQAPAREREGDVARAHRRRRARGHARAGRVAGAGVRHHRHRCRGGGDRQ